MTAPLERVRALIAKALDSATPEEEARSCALVAVRLISEHAMLDAPSPTDRPNPAWGARESQRVVFQTIWETLMANMAADFAGHGPAQGHPRPRARRPADPTYPGMGAWWNRVPCEIVIFTSRTCTHCRKVCEAGSTVWAHAVQTTGAGSGSGPVPRVMHMHCAVDSGTRGRGG